MKNELRKFDELCMQRDFFLAEKIARKLIKEYPNNFLCHKALGIALTAQKKAIDGLQTLNYADTLEENDFEVNNNLSFLYLEITAFKNAVQYAEKATAIDPNRPEPYFILAKCHLALRQYELSEKNARHALALRGGLNKNDNANLGETIQVILDSLLAQNKTNECIAICKEVLDHNHLYICFIMLVNLSISSIKELYVNRVVENLKEMKNGLNVSSFLMGKALDHFALAFYHERLKEKLKSEEHFNCANDFVLEWQRFMPLTKQKRLIRTVDFFSAHTNELKKLDIPKDKGSNLIFILGMPRSGTTLTESILATNSDLFAGGEMLFFEAYLKKGDSFLNLNEKNLIFKFFSQLGDQYLEQVDYLKKDKKYFTDKLPDNYTFFGYIKLMFPGAKFIYISRDPWDNAISIYKQNYLTNLLYSSSFFNIGLEYANHLFITDFWKNFFGDNAFLEVKYEELVQNPEKVTKAIWEHCNFNTFFKLDNRSDFYASTASKNQVRGEIHQKSLKKSDFLDKKAIFEDALSAQIEYWKKKFPSFRA